MSLVTAPLRRREIRSLRKTSDANTALRTFGPRDLTCSLAEPPGEQIMTSSVRLDTEHY